MIITGLLESRVAVANMFLLPQIRFFQTKSHFYLLVSIYSVFLFLPKMNSCLAGIFSDWQNNEKTMNRFMAFSRTDVKNPLEVLTQPRESSVSNFARSLDATIQLSCFLRQTTRQQQNQNHQGLETASFLPLLFLDCAK